MRDEVKQSGWKEQEEEKHKSIAVSFDLAAAIASVGLVAAAALVFLSSAHAAIARPGAEGKAWKSGTAALSCEDRLQSLYLAGSFVMPGSTEQMQLWVGRPRGETEDKEVWGVLARQGSLAGCEAQCKVIRFERFQKDMKPALMELDCEGARLRTMKMPLHIQWVRGEKNKFETLVRLGSSLYGVEEAPMQVQVNRYAVATAK